MEKGTKASVKVGVVVTADVYLIDGQLTSPVLLLVVGEYICILAAKSRPKGTRPVFTTLGHNDDFD